MKRIILLFALFYSLAFGQGWNNTVTTSIYDFNFLVNGSFFQQRWK